MNEIWFTGDTHFQHQKCWELFRIKEGKPTFASVEEMNEMMIANWNERVKKGDRVYHLGDFALGNIDGAAAIAKRLNGQIFLIRGNHEKVAEHKKVRDRFVWIKDYFKLKVDEQKVFMLHYPMLSWNCMHHGSWHLHGHCHGTLNPAWKGKRMDVGVDANSFRPVNWDEVAAFMAKKEFEAVDHHMEDEDENDTDAVVRELQ